MTLDLLQVCYLVMAAVYVVSVVCILCNRKFAWTERIIVATICAVLGGACYALSTVSASMGAFVVGIVAGVLCVTEAMRKFGEYKRLRGTGYLVLALMFVIALIKHKAFN